MTYYINDGLTGDDMFQYDIAPPAITPARAQEMLRQIERAREERQCPTVGLSIERRCREALLPERQVRRLFGGYFLGIKRPDGSMVAYRITPGRARVMERGGLH